MIGLSLVLRITISAACIVLFILIIRLIGQGRLQIRYSLLWMALILILLLCALFPAAVSAVSQFFGFENASNFLFFAGIIVLLCITLSLSMVVSWQARYIRRLVQSVALLEHRISEIEANRTGDSSDDGSENELN